MAWRWGVAAVLCVALAAACAPPDADPQEDDEPSQPVLTPGGAERVPDREPRHFDAGDLAVGDTVLGLRVAFIDVQRVFEDSVWSGTVIFDGEITVTGVYERHFDYPEPDALCFRITDAASIARLPEFAPDTWTSPGMWTWFCFTNPAEARAALGDGAAPRRATIVIDRYANHRIFSDVFDTARLVRVLSPQS